MPTQSRFGSSVALALLAAFLASSTASNTPGPVRKLLTDTWNPPTPPLPSYPCKTSIATTGFRTIWVDPRATVPGRGTARAPYATFGRAWASLPKFSKLARGVVINIRPGIAHTGESLWMEGVWGTAAAPVVVQRAPGSAGEADLQSINVYNCTYLYFKNLMFRQPDDSFGGGDLVHVAHSDYIHLLGVTMIGQQGDLAPQETLKVNQVQGMYLEDSDISHAGDNAVDYVAVQYGHVCRNKIHHGNWCFYVKGGSAYLLIDGNTVSACGEAGLRVGQGTGFEYMVKPWLQYEAYGVQVTNNIVYDVWGAGLGVAGGFNVLVAHNSVYDCGSRSHVVEFLFGSHSCDGDTELDGMCNTHAQQGGWGPRQPGQPAIPVPNKNVYFMNNLVVNPADHPSEYAHFEMQAQPTDETPGRLPGMLNPSAADNLRIAGNVIINRRRDGNPMDLGLSACVNENPTCNVAKVNTDNTINKAGLTVSFTSLQALTLAAASKGGIRRAWQPAALPAFPQPWTTPGLETPAGNLANVVPYDKNGVARTQTNNLPGAQL